MPATMLVKMSMMVLSLRLTTGRSQRRRIPTHFPRPKQADALDVSELVRHGHERAGTRDGHACSFETMLAT
jgi:hypothetical protein